MIRKEILIFAILLLTACSLSSSDSAPTQTSPDNRTSVVGNTLTPTVIFTPPPKLTSSPASETKFVQNCLPIEDTEIILKDVASGTILLFTGLEKSIPFLLDIQTNQRYELPVQSDDSLWGGFQVSPDRNMFAYLEDVQNNQLVSVERILWVVNPHGDVLAKEVFSRTDLYKLRWLDNQRLLFYSGQTDENGTVIVFNPFTRTQQSVVNEFPRLFTSDIFRGLNWRVEYSPDLEWAVYLGETNESGLGPIVWDVTTQQVLWQTMVSGTYTDEPVWSPMGDEVAVLAGKQIYLIGRSGQAKAILDPNQDNQPSAPAWSTDKHYIAFWNLDRLMIYDRHIDQVTDICIENDTPTHTAPLWSPDSQQLAVEVYIDQGDGNATGFGALADVQRNAIYKLPNIPDTIYPSEWMNSVP